MTDLRKAAEQALEALHYMTIGTISGGSDQTKAAITAMREALSKPDVPEGFKLVPVEPTLEMVWACKDRFIPRIALPFFVAAYKTMIAAAPQPKDTP